MSGWQDELREKVARAMFPMARWGKDNPSEDQIYDMEDARYRADAAIRVFRAMSGWHPISTAPKDRTEMIGLRSGKRFIFRWASSDEHPGTDLDDGMEGWWTDILGWLDDDQTPTHWQHLPPIPEDAP
jgi:hypothetical protein